MLEQTDAAVAGLINKFSAITPELMNTFRNQLQVSYIYGMIGLVSGALILTLSIIFLIYVIKFVDKNNDAGKAFGMVFSSVGVIVGITLVIAMTMQLIQISINPDFYILQNYIKPLITGSP